MNYDVVKVFDFDDTLATSHGFIRVLHFESRQPVDTVAWLGSLGITATEDIAGSARISTEEFAHYSRITHSMVEKGALSLQKPGSRIGSISTDVVDFEGVSKLHSPQPVDHILRIAKKASKDKHLIGVITGRSGSSSLKNVLGETVPVKNREEIYDFLTSHGLKILEENIHCVGDMPGGVPMNKARVMETHFVRKYNPQTIVFYDDDVRNLNAVESVDRRIRCINAKEMESEWGTVKSVLEAGRARRRGISAWSTAVKNAGFDR
jgi:hypothetical protein